MTNDRLVLDTNIYRSINERQLDQLAARGFKLSVSDTALTETWARSVAEFRAGKSRQAARGHLFKRARTLRPYFDQEYPVAMTGSHAVDRIRQQISGVVDANAECVIHAPALRSHWQVLSTIGYSDEEWLAPGPAFSEFLEEIDGAVFNLARPLAELMAKVDREHREEAAAFWKQPPAQILEDLGHHLSKTCWEFEAPLAERLDAHVRVSALRLYLASTGASRPKENDGGDVRMCGHLGEGFILLTDDKRLIRLVDESGSFQAPWVRTLADLEDPLPAGPPWGPDARQASTAFRRRA